MKTRIACLLCTALLATLAGAQENLLANGGFEQWDKGTATGWRVSELREEGWHKVDLRPSDERKEGRLAVLLPMPSYEPEGFVIMAQALPAEKIQHGKTVFMKLVAKADAGNQLHFVLAFDNRGTREKIRRQHSGSGEWEELEWKFDVPDTADPASFVIEIMNKPGGTEPAIVDDVQAYFEEIEPLYDLPEKASANAK